MRKKVALTTEVLVKLSEEELRLVQLELETNRKPTEKQVRKFFEEAIEHELERLAEEHPADFREGEED